MCLHFRHSRSLILLITLGISLALAVHEFWELRILMKLFLFAFILTSVSVQAASPFLNTKERLRLHLWVYGLEETNLNENHPKKEVKKKPVLPEEIERALLKI